MKDIQYFLDVEDKYCQTIPEEVEVWDEDVQEWDYKRILQSKGQFDWNMSHLSPGITVLQ